jgi:xanthine/CO dehydrogenase XdhC/CoxF family maturation factor
MNALPDLAVEALNAAAQAARAACVPLAAAPRAQKDKALLAAAAAIRAAGPRILAANTEDLMAAENLSPAFQDRLTLTPARIEAMARGVEEVAALEDPAGRVLAEWTRPNGLRIRRVAQPIGVIGMVFESRPNVLADAGEMKHVPGVSAPYEAPLNPDLVLPTDQWPVAKCVEALLKTPTAYLGVIGSQRKALRFRARLEAAGFTCEGLIRRAEVRDGRVYDHLLYSRLRGE